MVHYEQEGRVPYVDVRVRRELDTVVSIGVGTRCDENGDENVVAPILERLGYSLERAKTNIGLGRVTNTPDESTKKEEPVPAMR